MRGLVAVLALSLATAGCGRVATIEAVGTVAAPGIRAGPDGRGDTGDPALFRVTFPEAGGPPATSSSGVGRIYACNRRDLHYVASLRPMPGAMPPAFEFHVPRDPKSWSRDIVRHDGSHTSEHGLSPEMLAGEQLCIRLTFPLGGPALTPFRDPTFAPIQAADFFT